MLWVSFWVAIYIFYYDNRPDTEQLAGVGARDITAPVLWYNSTVDLVAGEHLQKCAYS